MENVVDSLRWRYAVKKFDSQRILEEPQVEMLKEAFILSASSYGLQPIRLLVIHNKNLQERLVTHSYGQRQVADASHVLVLCIETKIDSDYIEGYFNRVQEVRGTPQEILDPFKQSLLKRFAGMSRVQIGEWAKNQAYLALGKLLAVCAFAEIDSCPMEGFNKVGYDNELGLSEKGLEAVLVFPVGYRAKDDTFSTFKKVRRAKSETILEINDFK
jgi:nitroreductase